MRKLALLGFSLLFAATSAVAQKASDSPPSDPRPDVSNDLLRLQEAVDAQQREILKLRAEVERQSRGARPAEEKGQTVAAESGGSPDGPGTVVPAVRTQSAQQDAGAPPTDPEKRLEALESPTSLRYKGITITPGGFLDLMGVYRSTDVGSGLGTSFSGIPFSNTTAGKLSETRISAQNSRLSLRVNGRLGSNDVTAYVESDFLGAAPTNQFVTSNGNAFRMRLYWVDDRNGPWEVLAGQSWSFLTPNRNGLSPAPGDIFFTQNVDTNYQVGLTWTRAAQFRVVYHPSEQLAMGVAFENPEQYVGGAVVLPSALSSAYGGEVDNGALPGTPNVAPDILPKIAYDTRIGDRHFHVEAVGLVSFFKVYNPLTKSDDSTTGLGGSLNMNIDLAKSVRLVVNTFYSYGGGRYIFGLAPDLVIRPDGTVAPVHAASTVSGFEFTLSPTTNAYVYYGGTTIENRFARDSAGAYSGYGFPGSSSSANRVIQEGTVGFSQAFWKSPKVGTLSVLGQYSYVSRTPWSVAAGSPRNARTNLVYVDVRYALP